MSDFGKDVKQGVGLGVGFGIGKAVVEGIGPFGALVLLLFWWVLPIIMGALLILAVMALLPLMLLYVVVTGDYSALPENPEVAGMVWAIGVAIGAGELMVLPAVLVGLKSRLVGWRSRPPAFLCLNWGLTLWSLAKIVTVTALVSALLAWVFADILNDRNYWVAFKDWAGLNFAIIALPAGIYLLVKLGRKSRVSEQEQDIEPRVRQAVTEYADAECARRKDLCPWVFFMSAALLVCGLFVGEESRMAGPHTKSGVIACFGTVSAALGWLGFHMLTGMSGSRRQRFEKRVMEDFRRGSAPPR